MKWIVVQNKTKMVNADNIVYLQIREMIKANDEPSEWRLEAVYGEDEDSFLHLGVYPDKEFVQSLFTDIVLKLNRGNVYYNMPPEVS